VVSTSGSPPGWGRPRRIGTPAARPLTGRGPHHRRLAATQTDAPKVTTPPRDVRRVAQLTGQRDPAQGWAWRRDLDRIRLSGSNWAAGVVVAADVADDFRQVGGAGQRRSDFVGQRPVVGVGRDGQWGRQSAEGILDCDVIAVGGEQDADGGTVAMLRAPQEVVDDVDVEVQLSDVFWLRRNGFQFKANVANLGLPASNLGLPASPRGSALPGGPGSRTGRCCGTAAIRAPGPGWNGSAPAGADPTRPTKGLGGRDRGDSDSGEGIW